MLTGFCWPFLLVLLVRRSFYISWTFISVGYSKVTMYFMLLMYVVHFAFLHFSKMAFFLLMLTFLFECVYNEVRSNFFALFWMLLLQPFQLILQKSFQIFEFMMKFNRTHEVNKNTMEINDWITQFFFLVKTRRWILQKLKFAFMSNCSNSNLNALRNSNYGLKSLLS